MIFKIFKSIRKIFYGISAIVLVFNFFGIKHLAWAMFDEIYRPEPIRAVARNPFINEPDEKGWTLLMRAIQEHNSKSVKEYLEQGADLTIVPKELSENYSNAFEYLCDLKIKEGRGDFAYGEYEHEVLCVSPEAIEEYYEIVNIILQHCVDDNSLLTVNIDMLINHDDTIYTVWDCYAKWHYWELNDKYPHLFKYV